MLGGVAHKKSSRASVTRQTFVGDDADLRTAFSTFSQTAEYKNELENLIHGYDKNKDGKFDRDEVRHIVEEVKFKAFVAERNSAGAKRLAESYNETADKAKMQCRALIFSLSLVVLLVALMGGMMAIVSEATKESHVKENSLVGLNGKPVKTANVKRYSQLVDLPAQSADFIKEMSKVSLVIDNVVHTYTISRFVAWGRDDGGATAGRRRGDGGATAGRRRGDGGATAGRR
eukprot:g6669.t1